MGHKRDRDNTDGTMNTTTSPRFCPKCNSVMYQGEHQWVCRSCGFEPDKVPSETGATFTAHIDRISSSGNGMVQTATGQINIGPVTEGSVGSEVRLRRVSSTFCYCLTDGVTKIGYDNEFEQFVDSSEYCNNCGAIKCRHRGEWRCLSCGFESLDQDNKSAEDADSEDESPPDQEGDNIEQNPAEGLEKLREQAKEEAVETVPEEVTTSGHTTAQYSRSSKVREYVKSRADGVCEGCNKPAPFTSATGEPYLHAHHINELSAGGSDTPDTVVALCPNCHYQVHHGEDGDKYNKKLAKVVERKE